MNWKDHFIVFDTETTGLDSDARIIEIGFIEVVGGEIGQSDARTFYPKDVDWQSEKVAKALEVNHLDEATLRKEGNSFEDSLPWLWSFLSAPVWVGHNIVFDMKMLAQEFGHCNDTCPSPEMFSLCTMQVSASLDRQPSFRYRLADVAERMGITVEGDAHRALTDALTCAYILKTLLPQLPDDAALMPSLLSTAEAGWKKRNTGRRR